MVTLRYIALTTLVGFTATLLWALDAEGFAGMFEMVGSRPMTIAAVSDLVIALSICALGMWHDARRFGKSALPYIAVTVLTGSIGPLAYLVARSRWSEEPAGTSTRSAAPVAT